MKLKRCMENVIWTGWTCNINTLMFRKMSKFINKPKGYNMGTVYKHSYSVNILKLSMRIQGASYTHKSIKMFYFI